MAVRVFEQVTAHLKYLWRLFEAQLYCTACELSQNLLVASWR